MNHEDEKRNVKKCSNCVWCDKFQPRKDEIERGFLLGCKYPNYEGYILDETKPECGGTWFCPVAIEGRVREQP